MHNRLFSKLICFCAAAAMLMQGSAALAGELGELLHESSIGIAKDTNLTNYAFWQTDKNRRQQEYYLETKPNDTAMPYVVYGNKLYGRSTIKEVNTYLEDNNLNAVAGINADYFSLETGLPLGMVVTDGVLRCSDAGEMAIGFTNTGAAFIGTPAINITAEILSGADGQPVLDADGNPAAPVTIDHLNKLRQPFAVYLMTSDFSANTRNKTAGTDVVLRIKQGSLKIGGDIIATVESKTDYDGAIAITDDMLVVTCDKNGPISRLDSFAPGQTVKFSVSSADKRFNEAVCAVGAGEKLVTLGNQESNLSASTLAARTAFGIKADGTIVMYVNDGKQDEYSSGLSLKQLAVRMIELGCVEAINLDGGGSSALSAEYPGSGTVSLINSPSDGTMRRCANYIFLLNKTAPSGNAEKLFLYPYDTLMLPGAQTSFSIRATDGNYNAATLNSPVSYAVSDSALGTVDDKGVFTAGSAPMTARVWAKSGAAEGFSTVNIIDKPDEIVIKDEASSKMVENISLDLGESVSLSASAYYKTFTLKAQDNLFNWSAIGAAGTITPEGTFTASDIPGAVGVIKAENNGVYKEITVKVGKKPVAIEGFETSNHAAGGQADKIAVAEQSNTDFVRYGTRSAVLTFSGIPKYDQAAPVSFVAPLQLALPDAPAYLNLYVYGDNSGADLYAAVTANGQSSSVFAGKINFTGWKRFNIALPQKSTGLAGLEIRNNTASEISGRIYIDEIQAAYNEFCDETPPAITIENASGLLGAETISFTATVLDDKTTDLSKDKIKLLRDGEEVPFEYNAITGKMIASINSFDDMKMHRITVTAEDDSGNIGKASADINTGLSAVSSFADTSSHFSNGYANFLYSQDIVSGSTVGSMRYFYPDRQLTRQEFAKIICNFLAVDVTAYSDVQMPYSDEASISEWALPYVRAMYAKGIIRGKDLGSGKLSFDPSGIVTRAELVTIVGRTQQKGYPSISLSFLDSKEIPDYALPYAQTLTAQQVLAGYDDNTFRPKKAVTRGEMAKIFYNLY